MKIPLEDQYSDVLGKAARGLGIAPSRLARQTGIDAAKIEAVMRGEFDAEAVRALAVPLELDGGRLVALGTGSYAPRDVSVSGLRQFTTPFDDMSVNAYLVWDEVSGEAAIFDTGSDAGEMIGAAKELGVAIRQIFITHSHGDHIYDIDRAIEKTRAAAWTPVNEPVGGCTPFEPGREFRIGALAVETRLTCGHARGGVTYVVRGLDRTLAICGDAMFAGSMGGGAVSYADALRTNREAILTLPPETVLCPGHGPLTTVGEEAENNPFFP